jgi:hypothetical protein
MQEGRTGEACKTHGELRLAYNIVVGKLGRYGNRFNLREIDLEDVDPIHLAQDRARWFP